MFLLKENNSCHKKSILITGNQILSKGINCSQKNSISLVKLSLLTLCNKSTAPNFERSILGFQN